MKAKKQITIRLDESMIERLKECSERYGMPYGKIIEDGIKIRLLEIKNGKLDRSYIRSEEL